MTSERYVLGDNCGLRSGSCLSTASWSRVGQQGSGRQLCGHLWARPVCCSVLREFLGVRGAPRRPQRVMEIQTGNARQPLSVTSLRGGRRRRFQRSLLEGLAPRFLRAVRGQDNSDFRW